MSDNHRIVVQFEAALDQVSADRTAGGAVTARPTARADELCRAVVEVLPVDAAALSVFLTSDVSVPVAASDAEAALADDLQFTTGEGPCRLAYRSRRPVHVRDIRRPDAAARSLWPTWSSEFTRRTPYLAVSAVPMLVSGSALGALSLFSKTAPSQDRMDEALAVCARITRDLLSDEALGEEDPAWLDTPISRRRAVWKAQGITMRAQGITARQALTLLRAHALAVHRPLVDIAQDVVHAHLLLTRPEH